MLAAECNRQAGCASSSGSVSGGNDDDAAGVMLERSVCAELRGRGQEEVKEVVS